MEKDLFSLTVTSDGHNWINKFSVLAGLIFLFSILISIIGLFNFYLRILYFTTPYFGDPFAESQIWVSRIYGLLIHILIPIQAFYYFKFSRESRAAVNIHNSETFNRSFRFLYLSAVWSAVVLSLNLIYIAFQTSVDWILAHRLVS